MDFRFGFRYVDGKLLIYKRYKGNPGFGAPAWAVDIREILAMIFVGASAWFFIYKGEYEKAMYILLPLLGYAIGRTIPGTLMKRGGEVE